MDLNSALGMADGAVSFLLVKLDAFASREWKLDDNIKKKVRDLEIELRSIQAFLKDADAKKDHDNHFKVWIQNVRNQAYEIEDVLDLFRLSKAESVFHRRNVQHSINDLLKDIDTRLETLQKTKERYPSVASTSTSAGNNTYLHVRVAPLYSGDRGIVGIEEPRDELVSWVSKPVQRLEVMFVVGMAGLGKTTLVHSVYEKVKGEFNCHAWITASKSKTKPEILRSMLEKFGDSETQGGNIVDLTNKLRSLLCNKRYVVVLDDLWVKDVWESIKFALPNGDNSRIIITTRRGDIANSFRYDDSISVYNLKPLPWKEAERLFYTTTFSNSGRCPPGLEEVSRSILLKCDGLPLGIIEIGKLLSNRHESALVWQKLLNSLESELRSGGDLSDIMTVLSASYNDLPYHLKYCFLYMSMFPENNPVKRRRLIRLWIAEGFVTEKKCKTLEEVGEEYLNALIHRSLIKVNEMGFDGRPASVGVHSLMHKMIISISHEENFSTVYSGSGGNPNERTQRLSFQKDDFDTSGKLPNVRTFISFCTGRVNIASNFKLLKVLDIQGTPLGDFPSAITDLLLLRYLSLRKTNIKKIPKSLGKLLLLETLDLKQTLVSKLPKAVLQLDKLRYLMVCGCNMETTASLNSIQGFNLPKKIGKLKSLQKLSFVKVCRQPKMIKELENLTQLRKLGIVELAKEDGKTLCQSIQKMPHLQSLTVTSLNKEQPLELDAMTNPPCLLQCLHLVGPLERFPNWVSSLHDLARLRLKWSSLTGDKPIAALGDLPNLIELQLLNAYTGTQWEFHSGQFQKLKILELEQLTQLQFILMEDGTLPCLQKLIIKNCSELVQVPVGIDKFSRLQELLLYDLPERFISNLRKNGGVLRELVHHIPHIHSYKHGKLEEDLS